MQAGLMATGLQQYWRRLNEMGYTRLGHVLRLGRGDKLEELLEQLKPMPGHRVRLLNFIEEERARAQAVGGGAAPPKAPQTLIPINGLKGGKSTSTVPRKLYKATPRPASASARAASTKNSTATTGSTSRVPSTAEAAAAAAVAAAAAAAHAAAQARSAGGQQKQGRVVRPLSASSAAVAKPAARSGLQAVRARPARLSPVADADEEAAAADDEAAEGADEEAKAVAFLRASWAREMLSDLHPSVTPQSMTEALGGDTAEVEAAVTRDEALAMGRSAGSVPDENGLNYTMVFEEDEEEEAAEEEEAGKEEEAAKEETAPEKAVEDEGKENAGDEVAAVQQAMRRQLAGLGGTPPPLVPIALPPPPPIAEDDAVPTPRNAPGGGAAVVSADALSASTRLIRCGSGDVRQRKKGAESKNLLANSLDTYAAQRGVLWRPDRKDVYTSVAFVLQQHIATRGVHLLVRTQPPAAAALSAAPTQLPSPADSEPPPAEKGASPSTGGGAPRHATRLASSGPDSPVEPEAMASPGLPPSVRRSFIRGADSMHGVRYSLDLSPVVEAARRAGQSRAPGGKFGVPVGPGEEQFANEPWAQDDKEEGGVYAANYYEWSDEEEEAVDLNDTGVWEGGWTPPADDFSLFDERVHPMRPGASGTPTQQWMPDVSCVSNYIRSLTQSARMGAEASVVALAYIERFVSAGGFVLDENTWRRCALTAWLIAAKMWDDDCLENREFADLFGHDHDDLNALEMAFTKSIGYKLSITSAEYARYYFALRSICQATTESFPLRLLDAELEAKLERSKHAVSGAARGRWADWLEQADLSRSV